MDSISENVFDNCIFRYRSVTENNMDALRSGRLYFSTPDNFNDPYDNLMYANLGQICSDICGNLEYRMDGYLEEAKQHFPYESFITYNFWNGPRKEELVKQHLGLFLTYVEEIKENIRKNVKIICFSEKFDSILMWSHYADYHKGYLLVYDKEELRSSQKYTKNGILSEKKTRLEKVEYVTEKLDLTEAVENYVRYEILPNMGDIEKQDGKIAVTKLREFVIQKAKEWEYEKEWRLIPRIISLEEESELCYIVCKPKGIILGAKCSEENRKLIIDIAEENDIPVYRMLLNDFSSKYGLEIKKI